MNTSSLTIYQDLPLSFLAEDLSRLPTHELVELVKELKRIVEKIHMLAALKLKIDEILSLAIDVNSLLYKIGDKLQRFQMGWKREFETQYIDTFIHVLRIFQDLALSSEYKEFRVKLIDDAKHYAINYLSGMYPMSFDKLKNEVMAYEWLSKNNFLPPKLYSFRSGKDFFDRPYFTPEELDAFASRHLKFVVEKAIRMTRVSDPKAITLEPEIQHPLNSDNGFLFTRYPLLNEISADISLLSNK